jgi:hypothetical protein
MGLLDKLEKARNYVRRQRGPDSYFQYKRKREDERNEDEQTRERARQYADHDRGEAERGREFDQRYEAERKDDAAGKPDQKAK